MAESTRILRYDNILEQLELDAKIKSPEIILTHPSQRLHNMQVWCFPIQLTCSQMTDLIDNSFFS